MRDILLYYLRNFPIEIGKKRVSNLVNFNNQNKDLIYDNKSQIKFHLNLDEYVMRQIYLFDIYEKPYVKLLTHLTNIKTIFDIGANIGNYTLSFAKAYSNATIHAFEPNTINFNRLQENISLNNFKNIRLNKKGLSNEKGELKLFFDDKNMGASTLANGSGNKTEIISLITLDEYCQSNNIQQIDLLKIDIEGGELNCLKGGKEILKQSKNTTIQLEIDSGHCKRMGYTSNELFQFLVDLEFKPFLLNKFGKLKPITQLPDNFIGNVIYKK
jgi:FkbM family methyltransferase